MEKIANMNPELLQSLTGLTEAAKAKEEEASEKYDKETLLRFGLVDWSYDVVCEASSIAQLDPKTYEWVIEEITRMNTHGPLAASSSSA